MILFVGKCREGESLPFHPCWPQQTELPSRSILLHLLRTAAIVAHLSPLQDLTTKRNPSGNDVTKWEKMRIEGPQHPSALKKTEVLPSLQIPVTLVNKNLWNIYGHWPVMELFRIHATVHSWKWSCCTAHNQYPCTKPQSIKSGRGNYLFI